MTRPSSALRLSRATLSDSVWYSDRLITFLAIGDDTAGKFALLWASGHPHPAERAREIVQRVHEPHVGASDPLTRAKVRLMLALVAHLRPLLPAVAADADESARVFRQQQDSMLFASLPRAAARLALRLLAERGDDRRRCAAIVQTLGGTAPVP